MYTREEILSMPAGHELDEAVAIHIMGRENNKTTWGQRVFSPSTDIAAAWEVVEKMESLHLSMYPNHLGWAATIKGNSVHAETAPLAICKASLLAILEV